MEAAGRGKSPPQGSPAARLAWRPSGRSPGQRPDDIPAFEPDDDGGTDRTGEPPDFGDGGHGGPPRVSLGGRNCAPGLPASANWSGRTRRGKRWRDGMRWQKPSPVDRPPRPRPHAAEDRIAWLGGPASSGRTARAPRTTCCANSPPLASFSEGCQSHWRRRPLPADEFRCASITRQ